MSVWISGQDRVLISGEERAREHVFLRNEPDLPACLFERIHQKDRDLERWRGFFESGSFGEKRAARLSAPTNDLRMRRR
jgi:hypothetical protein